LRPWLKDDPAIYLFSPAEAVALRYAERRAKRKTKIHPSQAARQKKESPQRAARERFDKNSYRQAIARACSKVGFPPGTLTNFVTASLPASELYGLEAAQVVLGHAKADVTQV
jgi:hypothetical protein